MAPRKTVRHGGAGLIDVNEEDLSFAVRQDQFNCAIVRAIQRKIPEALFVVANKQNIAFTMPGDKLANAPEKGVRYKFATPQDAIDNIIRPLDLGEKTVPFSFILGDAIAARPMRHTHPGSRVERQRGRLYRADRNRRNRSKNPAVRTYERFTDQVVSEG